MGTARLAPYRVPSSPHMIIKIMISSGLPVLGQVFFWIITDPGGRLVGWGGLNRSIRRAGPVLTVRVVLRFNWYWGLKIILPFKQLY